jgi:4-nitrophenyl phosphatase
MPKPSQAILNRLHAVKGFVFDMDGTLILGDKKNNNMRPLPGAIDFLKLLSARSIPWVVMTNGTARPPREYIEVLSGAGLPMQQNNMMTPSSVAAQYFHENGYKRVMVLGCPGVWEPLADLDIEVVLSNQWDGREVDAVYVGWYREFGFVDLEAGCKALLAGASFYTASDVPFFASAQGPAIGTSCAIAAALKSLTNKSAEVLGKPSQYALQAAAKHLKLAVHDIAVVGDDADLEVPMALQGGSFSVYVHTGTGGAGAFLERPAVTHPHISVPAMADLLELYKWNELKVPVV